MHASVWSDMLAPGLPVLEKVLRPVLVYAFLVIGFRVAGKRELAQLNPFDLVVLLTISNTVQNAIIGDDNSVTGGIIGATTLFLVNYVVVRFLYQHDRLERVLEGEPDVLIDGGRVREDRLRGELITLAELEMAAHKQGFGSLEEVDRAILEPGGGITFIGRKPQPEESRHEEVIARLDALAARLDALGRRGGDPGPATA